VQLTLVLGAVVTVVLFVFHRRFVLRAFDPDTAEALGLAAPSSTVLLMTLALTVVVALRSIATSWSWRC